MDQEKQTQALKDFVPKINNWAICDYSCVTYRVYEKGYFYWFAFLETVSGLETAI